VRVDFYRRQLVCVCLLEHTGELKGLIVGERT